MATGEFFDIVVRAKSIVSQGFQQAIAEAKGAAGVFASMSGDIGLGKAAAGAGAAANAIGRAFDKLVMNTREARGAVAALADEARRLEKAEWGGLSAGLVAMAEAAKHSTAMLALNNDFAKKRLAIEADIQAKIGAVEAERLKQSAAASSEMKNQSAAYAPDENYLTSVNNRENINAAAATRMVDLIKELRLGLIEEVDRAEKEAADRQQQAWEEEAERNRVKWVHEEQSKIEETEAMRESLARQAAENVELELRNAGKLLEADRARNAEQARASLERARSDEERRIIQDRHRLLDDKAAQDQAERDAAAAKRETKTIDRGKSAGFDLVEITSRVSGFAALQRAGHEAATQKLGDRMERAMGKVQWECGEIARAVKQKRMDGIGLAF